MAKLIHSMIRVLDLQRSLEFYRQGFGLQESHRLEFPTFKLVYLRDADSGCEIELTWNQSQSEPYTHGSGYGHVAFCVDDLSAHRELLLRHARVIDRHRRLVVADGLDVGGSAHRILRIQA